ncbi:MAG: serine hydrolase, partial [Maribacter sp.]
YGVGIMAFGNLTYTGPLPSTAIEKLLFGTAQWQTRQLPVSDILVQRQEQVLRMLQTWDTNLEKEIVAENLYMDESRERRMTHVQEVFEKAGEIIKVETIVPRNQLRGSFKIQAAQGSIEVYFTLTPEKIPKVQDLYVSFDPKESN